MSDSAEVDLLNVPVVERWCQEHGDGWLLTNTDALGRGATASVYEISSPNGLRSLKLYDEDFSKRGGEIGVMRIQQQRELGEHNCPSLVQVFEGGTFEGRLYLLMTRAPGQELEKVLSQVPRDKIRGIVDQVARAVLFLNVRGICHRDIKSANVFVSDDYAQAMLLDISVMRAIHDPAGVGTDHDGQLPVVATTRYTPPEYLFRLLETGPQLWYALDVYQLGGLLHDLIMGHPLFETESNARH
jgi:serine/threonine-protein kinase